MAKKIKIVYTKLGRYGGRTHTVHGRTFKVDRIVYIEERLKDYSQLHTMIHEIFHVQNPEWSETMVTRKARELARLLWEQGYRKEDQNP